MNGNRHATKKELFFIVSIFIPVMAIVFGCILLFSDTLFNRAFAITYVVLPLISIVLLSLIIFAVKKTIPKIILTIVVLVVFGASFLIWSTFGTFESLRYTKDEKAGESYTEVCEAFAPMPTLEEIGAYTQVEHYDYFSNYVGIFTCDADTLIVHYNADEYQAQKGLLESKYVFQKDEMTALNYICEPSVEIDGYLFRALDITGEYGFEVYYPKKLVFVVTNDRENTISYIAFCDDDLDYIESLEEFLLNDCGWKHIIK